MTDIWDLFDYTEGNSTHRSYREKRQKPVIFYD